MKPAFTNAYKQVNNNPKSEVCQFKKFCSKNVFFVTSIFQNPLIFLIVNYMI